MSNKSLLFERPENIGNPSNFFIDYIGQITEGTWPVAITFMTFAVIYFNLPNANPREAYGAASFVSLLVVSLLVALGAFESSALIICILMVVIAVVIN